MTKTAKKQSAGRPKSNEKQHKILESATELFLSQGFERTSMDAVAKHSGVSKQTVYSHFNNKDELYNSVIENKCIFHKIDEKSICLQSTPLQTLLENIAQSFVKLLVDPAVISMYRTVIGESTANPKVAQLFYEAGPLHSVKLVKRLLEQHPESQLPEDKAFDISRDFFNLLKGDYHMRGILNLSYDMNPAKQESLAKQTAQKIMIIIKNHAYFSDVEK